MFDFIKKLLGKPNFVSLKGATPEDIETAEYILELQFAEDYKAYLLEYGLASFEGHELTGICNSPRLNVVDVTQRKRLLSPEVDQTLYVIEDANINGITIWQNKNGEVFETSYDEPIKPIASSLSEYLHI